MQNQGEKNLPVESDVNNKDLVEIRFYNETLQRFIESYEDKAAEESDEQWLASRYKEEFSEWSKEEAETNAHESIDGIKTFETNHAELNEAIDKGQSKEVWFANKLAESAQGVPVADFGRYLSEVDNTLAMANEQMQRTILTQGGTVSANPNLDGFIAEQELVNTFNGRAALSESHYRAEVKVPGPGETYGKNSFDVVIRDTRNGNQIVHQYQIKYGKDAASTIRMLRESGEVTKYSNQRIVVPPEQVEEVQKAFPGKTVTSELGGTDKVSIKSDKLTKADAKQLQIEAQQQGKLPHKDWNDFSTQELSLKIGKETVLAGMQALTLSAGFNLASQLVKNGEIKGSELVRWLLREA